ncbi:MAG TPA: cyclase family protein, partial [Myxococcota bacterium]|nr:cyclase family protein [Myxococcota bacterium]
MSEARRAQVLNAESVREWGQRYSNWGRFGKDDERGALNFITPECVLVACGLPRRGAVISCALPFDQKGPQTGFAGRHNPVHVMLADGGDALAGAQDFIPGGFRYADDAIYMPLQCGTQWDALAHVFYDGKMWNDRGIELVTSSGARANSIDKIKDGVVGRGVLLDVPRHQGVRWLENGTPILPEDLDACAEAEGVAVESGDIVLVRTGMLTRCLEEKSWAGYCGGPAPGLSIHCARWLYEREVAAVATDTWGVEVLPNETQDCFQPLHMISLRNTGVLFGEIFQLDALAEACAADGNYAFLFAAPPLPITGAVGSPINPLA